MPPKPPELKPKKPRPLPRKVRYPDLDIPHLLAWADDFHRRTGSWPTRASGPVPEAPGTTWCGIDLALKRGHRGLIGGSSLAQLLQLWRGTRHSKRLPPLTYDQILAWADAYFARMGKWPTKTEGAVAETNGEKWSVIDMHLRHGGRGLPGGTSLGKLIARERGVRNQTNLSPFTEEQILAWAEAQYRIGYDPRGSFGELAAGEQRLCVRSARVAGWFHLAPVPEPASPQAGSDLTDGGDFAWYLPDAFQFGTEKKIPWSLNAMFMDDHYACGGKGW